MTKQPLRPGSVASSIPPFPIGVPRRSLNMKDIADILDTPNRRSFLKKSLVAGAVTAGAGILGSALSEASNLKGPRPTSGDIAILRFLAAAEIIETDLWEQYTELGGVTNGNQNN